MSGIQHERMRFGYMTINQLMTRLSRIKDMEKMRCFEAMAEIMSRETGDARYDGLAMMAFEKRLGVQG